MIESGYPGFVSDTFNALFAPAGTPPEVVALLVKHVQRGDEAAGRDRGGRKNRLPNCRRHAPSR